MIFLKEEKMRVVYPTLIEKSDEIYLVFVPDLMIYTAKGILRKWGIK